MSRYFLAGVLILASLSFIVSPCYACNTLPIAEIVNPYYQYICVGNAASFNGVGYSGTGSHDPDNGYPYGGGHGIDIYGWWYGYGNWDYSSGGTPSHTYNTAGSYWVYLYVYDDDGGWRSQYSDSCRVYVVEVASLLPDEGTEFDDGDADPDTKSFAVCIADTGVVTVTATPNPSVSEGNLPACWTLTGGTGSGKLSRTVDRTTSGITTITCTAGSSSKTTKVYVVEVQSLLPDEGTEFDDGDADPDTKSFAVCKADSGVVTVTATPNPNIGEPNLPPCWSLTGGTEVNDVVHTVSKTTPAKTVITCTAGSSSKTTTIYVMDANILEPKGSKDANPNPNDSFLQTGPYRFDFQWVECNVPGYYSNTIEGEILPASVISDLNAIDYFWSVSDGEFDPHDSGQPKKKTGTATPTYKATEIDSSITLTLDPNACGTITRELETFQDHLSRDYCNFETGIDCNDNWQFTKYNVTITMGGTWNCHGSTNHAFNGSGDGSSGSLSGTITGWDPNTHTPPINWTTVASQLDRGDVVAYYSNSGADLQHSSTCLSGSTTYGANNEAVSGAETWQWDTCTPQDWWNNAGTNNPPYPDCDTLVIYNNPN